MRLRTASEPYLALVKPFYIYNTAVTNITKTSKNTLNNREKWLVLPTPCSTQYVTIKIEAKNSVLSEQKPHHWAGKNAGDAARWIQKHQRSSFLASVSLLFFEKIISFLLDY
jgi:hypothetical protein